MKKDKALNTHLSQALYEELGNEHTKLFHADVCWLLRGKVLTRLFNLQELGKIFPEFDASFEWIRNPFGDKMHIKQVSCKLSSREVDSLVDTV